MPTDRDEDARRKRAEARRARELAGEVIAARTPDVALHEGTSSETRIARTWELTRRLWLFAGRAIREVPRHELPGEVFDIRAERRRAPG
ncbi:hypothetical protein [Sandaracinus amylolyticus]|uniref:hypothetical protein n=1 Tax=Sandaracinus amylolyticus TaxID=927083 RepID=UPI001F23DC9D|nr:hypothetical protein [Sandaracinus amylolyticus]